MNQNGSTQNLKLHFQRFEFKYSLTADQATTIKKKIAPYIVTDRFARDTQHGAYEVRSLYYDSPGFYYYHEKMDGVKKRKKIRLRTYKNNGRLEPYVFFEIKRKYDAVILKDRFVMSLDDYRALLRDDDFYDTQAVRDKNRREIIEEFEWEAHVRSITPKMLVVYDREPYLGRYNANFRVTFDSNIRAIENDNLFYSGDDFFDVSGGATVMELKFTGTLPFYVYQVIKEFNLERWPYSKYCNAVDACDSMSAIKMPPSAGTAESIENFSTALAVA